jgi:hypothetical protein
MFFIGSKSGLHNGFIKNDYYFDATEIVFYTAKNAIACWVPTSTCFSSAKSIAEMISADKTAEVYIIGYDNSWEWKNVSSN